MDKKMIKNLNEKIDVEGYVKSLSGVEPFVYNCAHQCAICGHVTKSSIGVGDKVEYPSKCRGCGKKDKDTSFKTNLDESDLDNIQKGILFDPDTDDYVPFVLWGEDVDTIAPGSKVLLEAVVREIPLKKNKKHESAERIFYLDVDAVSVLDPTEDLDIDINEYTGLDDLMPAIYKAVSGKNVIVVYPFERDIPHKAIAELVRDTYRVGYVDPMVENPIGKIKKDRFMSNQDEDWFLEAGPFFMGNPSVCIINSIHELKSEHRNIRQIIKDGYLHLAKANINCKIKSDAGVVAITTEKGYESMPSLLTALFDYTVRDEFDNGFNMYSEDVEEHIIKFLRSSSTKNQFEDGLTYSSA